LFSEQEAKNIGEKTITKLKIKLKANLIEKMEKRVLQVSKAILEKQKTRKEIIVKSFL
jgi:hypothetical protein